jgi:hypothetical protein
MSITVTVYNDDEFGRDIQVVQLSPYGMRVKEITIQRPEENGGSKCQQYQLKNGELLIVSTAEKVDEKTSVETAEATKVSAT